MHSKAILGHEDVTRILAAARAEAQKNNWAVGIAVVDDGGHLLAFERLDGAAATTDSLRPRADVRALPARSRWCSRRWSTTGVPRFSPATS
jgi:hypothetical protein